MCCRKCGGFHNPEPKIHYETGSHQSQYLWELWWIKRQFDAVICSMYGVSSLRKTDVTTFGLGPADWTHYPGLLYLTLKMDMSLH